MNTNPKETKPRTVLVIDDEPQYREMLSEILSSHGYDIKTASNGEEGLDIFETGSVDIVITDLKMDGLNGLEVLEKISKSSSNTPVIMLSGYGDKEEIKSALRLGAYDFITKGTGDNYSLKATIDRAWEKVCLTRENEQYKIDLENKIRERTLEVERLTSLIKEEHRLTRDNKEAAFKRIQHQAKKYRALISNAPNGFATISEGGALTSLNTSFIEVLGISSEKNIDEWVIFDEEVFKNNGIIDSFLHCRKQKKSHTEDRDYQGPDSKQKHIEYTLTPFELDDGFSSEVLFTIKDATLENEEKNRLKAEAMYDGLTGLIKQNNYNESMSEILKEERLHQFSVGLIHLDLDDFKEKNTKYGHQTASSILASIGRRIRGSINNGKDLGFRMGGDEFAIIFTNYTKGTLNTIVERLQNILSAPYNIECDNGTPSIGCSFSIGVTEYSHLKDQSAKTLYDEADSATFSAKNSGKGCYVFYNDIKHFGING